ncbi:fructosamine kinase family protein [Chitinophaga agrisoli]|uniref:Fructosamine kinase family protein n=1 Tax=Chitinophaga agrisoli TaxID=2607653 RepID=A0A5B2VKZ9_9BACT|nr:fructosamine kinase family protein [Chitinophaga agrisoli]KAA2239771.1 fructosamine kinase family protein [Chitinophaga agrisoli]
MMADALFLNELSSQLSAKLAVKIQINQAERIQGGDINETYRLVTNEGPWFLKVNDARRYPDMFAKEFSGLSTLRNTQTFAVPEPVCHGAIYGRAFLVTDYKEKGGASTDFWEGFAGNLIKLHQHTQAHFGFNEYNYIGTLKQYNTPYTNWAVFYAFNRIMPLAKQAYDRFLLDKPLVTQLEQLCKKFTSIFPDERPALLHGDLWSGNFMVGPDGKACIYDPAVYYGHREMDLAMTRLFGGFDTRFYYAYQSLFPLANGWQERISLCQLYPLLAHVLLFNGGSYVDSVKEVLKEWQ